MLVLAQDHFDGLGPDLIQLLLHELSDVVSLCNVHSLRHYQVSNQTLLLLILVVNCSMPVPFVISKRLIISKVAGCPLQRLIKAILVPIATIVITVVTVVVFHIVEGLLGTFYQFALDSVFKVF